MMLWAAVVAVFVAAIACAAAIFSWNQLSQQKRRLGVAQQELQTHLDAAASQQRERLRRYEQAVSELTSRVISLEISSETTADTPAPDDASDGRLPATIDEQMGERAQQAVATAMRRWANVHFTAAAEDAAELAELVRELMRFATYSLEREVGSGRSGPRLLRSRLYAAQPSVLDIGPELLDNLWAAFRAEPVYRQQVPAGQWSYLRWPREAPTPEVQLGSLLPMLTRPDSVASAERGMMQLREVVRALQDGGPAVLELGPVLVARTERQLSAGLAPGNFAGLDRAHLDAAVAGTPGLLHSIGCGEVVDLTHWAGSRAA
jgi:hypothetical protein